jgi:sec-independent protein translocase protein TatA
MVEKPPRRFRAAASENRRLIAGKSNSRKGRVQTRPLFFAPLLFAKSGVGFDKFGKIIMNTMFAVFGIGGMEVILILAVVLILFGAKKIPELAKGLGSGIKEFKKATKDVTDEIQNADPTVAATTVTPIQKLPPANTTAQSQTHPPETKVI